MGRSVEDRPICVFMATSIRIRPWTPAHALLTVCPLGTWNFRVHGHSETESLRSNPKGFGKARGIQLPTPFPTAVENPLLQGNVEDPCVFLQV